MARLSRFPLAAGLLLLPNTAWASNGDVAVKLVAMLLALAILVPLYFLPAIIGRKRQVTHSGWLFVVNLLFGASGVGWLVCLLWAVCGQTQAQDAYWRRRVGP
jgi:hypothetical protein